MNRENMENKEVRTKLEGTKETGKAGETRKTEKPGGDGETRKTEKIRKTGGVEEAKKEDRAGSKGTAVRISQRLKAVAGFVRPGSRIADIGTDHGYVPIYLAEQGRIGSALAMDVRPGPLERAKEHIREYEAYCKHPISITARLSDGLQKLSPGEADTVIIAGMGGELVIRILKEGRHVWSSVDHYILSPQSDLDKVRRFLAESGFVIRDETMVQEEGKYYTIMSVGRGQMRYDSQVQYLYGKILMEKKDTVLQEYLEKERRRIYGILEGLNAGDLSCETPAKKEARRERMEELGWIEEAQNEMQ